MVIQVGQPIKSSDFINESEASSTPSENAGKVPKLESDGKIDGSFLRVPVVRVYEPLRFGDNTSRINVTRPSGIISRYTWSGVGTNPQINSTNFAVGKVVGLLGFNSANNGDFVITASGNNYFEIENASGVAQSSVSGSYICVSDTWTKPSGLKYIEVELVGGGGGGGEGEGSGTGDFAGSGGGAGGYAKKIISVDDLGESETIVIGIGGVAGGTIGGTGGTTYFGSILSATGGAGGQDDGGYPGAGGSGTGGDINIGGEDGQFGTEYGGYGNGGLSFLGVLGAGGRGGSSSGQSGKNGIVIITEHY